MLGYQFFHYLGPVQFIRHSGNRPMSVTWRLSTPIPGKWLEQFLRLAA